MDGDNRGQKILNGFNFAKSNLHFALTGFFLVAVFADSKQVGGRIEKECPTKKMRNIQMRLILVKPFLSLNRCSNNGSTLFGMSNVNNSISSNFNNDNDNNDNSHEEANEDNYDYGDDKTTTTTLSNLDNSSFQDNPVKTVSKQFAFFIIFVLPGRFPSFQNETEQV